MTSSSAIGSRGTSRRRPRVPDVIYDEQLAYLGDIWGAMPLDVVEDRSFRQGIKDERDRIAERSERRADYFVTVLSIVLELRGRRRRTPKQPSQGYPQALHR